MPNHTTPPRFSGLMPGRVIMFLFLILLVLPGALSAPARAASSLRTRSTATLPNGSLVRDTTTGHISIIWYGQQHWIDSPAAFTALGYSMSSVTDLSTAELATIPVGNVIALNTVANGLAWPFAPLRADPVRLVLYVTGIVAGQYLSVDGSGFRFGEVVTVTGPSWSTSLAANATGNFLVQVPIPPTLGLGVHQIYAAGSQSGLFGVQSYYVTQRAAAPSITHQPDPVVAGTNVLVSGGGFAPYEQIQVFVNGGAADAVATAGSGGGFGPLAVLVPADLSGRESLLAYGASSHRSIESAITVTAAQNAPPPTPTTVPTPLPAATATPYVTPHLYVNPTSAISGAQVLVWGSGFTPGEVVLVRFNGTLLEGAAVNSVGDFGASLVTVPSGLGTGVYGMSATGSNSGKSATTNISVVAVQPVIAASIAVSPINPIAGSHVTVAGTGFQANETVVVYFNNNLQGNVTATASGSFTNGGFVVPAGTTPGSYSVRASGTASGRSASATLSVLAAPVVLVPQVFLSSSAVNPGAQITVTGRGFGSQETILVRIDGALIVPVNSDSSGSFSVSLASSRTYGKHILSVTGARTGLVAAIGFTVLRPETPGIGLIPNWAYRGGLVLVNGTSFVPGEIVLIDFRGVLVQAVTADGNGRFSRASFRVPTNTPLGYSTIKLIGSRSGRVATALLQVKSSAPATGHLKVSVKSAHRGAVVRLSGSGFDAREIVLVSYRGRLVMTFTTNTHGTFSNVSFKIPTNSPYGKSTISLLGTKSHRKASTTVQVTKVIGTGMSETPTVAHRGASITVTGHGFVAGETILIYLRGELVQAATADKNGNLGRTKFTVPSSMQTGVTTVKLVGAKSGRHVQVSVVII